MIRYKISISLPAIVAIFCFICGLGAILYYYLTLSNGRFVISIGVSALATYVLGLLLLAAFIFMFFRRRK